MLKVVIDTNVAVSALLSPGGNSAQIIEHYLPEPFIINPAECIDLLNRSKKG